MNTYDLEPMKSPGAFYRALWMPGATCLLIGCNATDGMEEAENPASPANLDPNAAPITEGAWYRPGLDVTWHWQLQGSINTTYEAEIYDVDLFETPDVTLQPLLACPFLISAFLHGIAYRNALFSASIYTTNDSGVLSW